MRLNEGFLLLILVLLPMLGAPACYVLSKKNRAMCSVLPSLICIAVLGLSAVLSVGVAQGRVYELTLPAFGGLGFSLRMDGFRGIYATITAFMWLAATLFGREYFAHDENNGRYQLFSLLTFAATVGVFLSADLFTTFMFFEWVSLFSYSLVAHNKSAEALRAAGTYLVIAVAGGLAMLMGLFLLSDMTGTLVIDELAAACISIADRPRLYVASALLLAGFGAKAGLFPLHIWLPQAHPAAPAPASALLSGVLTKTGIFGVILISCELLPGDISWGLALLALSVVTMLLGALLALFSTDLKKMLACSSISQIGFIVLGVAAQNLLGSHNALAVRGTLLHMVNHSLGKLVLFTVAGITYMNLHKLNLNDIRGWGRGKPLLAAAFLAGALNVAGIPLFGGYVSKTLLHESLVECIHLFEGLPLAGWLGLAEVLFLLAGGLTVAYMTKLFIAIFVEKPISAFPQKDSYMNPLTSFVLMAGALLLPAFGMLPHRLSEALAAFGEGFMHGHAPDHAVHYFAWINLKGAVISVTAGVVIYIVVVRGLLMRRCPDGSKEYADRWPGWLNLEERVYRPLLRLISYIFMRPSKSDRSISRFYRKYNVLFYPEKNETIVTQNIAGSFSSGLLLLSMGLCAVLAWLFWIYIAG